MSDAVPAALLAACACTCAYVAALEVSACVPDLPPDRVSNSNSDASPDGGTSPCGDGFIDLEAGEQCDPGVGAGAASASLCNMCKMQCPDGGFVWSGFNNHCYYLPSPVATTDSLSTATMDFCSKLTAHVVTFASETEFDEVTGNLPGDSFWVGLQNGPRYFSVAPYEPGWSPDCSGCYARAPGSGQPLPHADAGIDAATEACVKSADTEMPQFWGTHACANGDKLRVICEREPEGTLSQVCEAGVCMHLVVTWGRKSYVFQPNPQTADAAEGACERLGGTLVVLQSRDEREQLWHELSQLSLITQVPSQFWVGLSMRATEDGGAEAWVWDDKTLADAPDAYPPPWAVDQPREAGAGPRAYLAAMMGLNTVDGTLAQTDPRTDPQTTLPYVCQIPVTVP